MRPGTSAELVSIDAAATRGANGAPRPGPWSGFARSQVENGAVNGDKARTTSDVAQSFAIMRWNASEKSKSDANLRERDGVNLFDFSASANRRQPTRSDSCVGQMACRDVFVGSLRGQAGGVEKETSGPSTRFEPARHSRHQSALLLPKCSAGSG